VKRGFATQTRASDTLVASVALSFVKPKAGLWKSALTGGVVQVRNLVSYYRRHHSRRSYKNWGYSVRGIPNYTSIASATLWQG